MTNNRKSSSAEVSVIITCQDDGASQDPDLTSEEYDQLVKVAMINVDSPPIYEFSNAQYICPICQLII